MLTYKQKKAQSMRAGITALLLVILLLISGTFAWVSGTQRAFNPRWQLEGNHGGRIHDRFEMERVTGLQDLSVFAENFGESDLFVRIRLREFLAFDESPYGVGNAQRDLPNTWPIYRSSNTNVHQRRYGTDALYIGEHGIEWTLGQTSEKAFMPTFNRAIHETNLFQPDVPALYAHPHAHRMSEATGDAVDWFSYLPGASRYVPEEGRITHVSDIDHDGTQTGPGLDTAQHRLLDDGTRNNWSMGDSLTSPYIYSYILDPTTATSDVDLRLGSPRTHYAQATLLPALDETTLATGITVPTNFPGVITLNQWHEWGQPSGDFWIHDNTDDEGWFYWNGFLQAGENDLSTATSLLLSAINIPEWGNAWEYVVMAEGEFFISASLDALSPTISDSARDIFDHAEERAPLLGGDIHLYEDGDLRLTVPGATSVSGPNGTILVTIPSEVNMDLVNISREGNWRYTVTENSDGTHTITFTPPAPTYEIDWAGTNILTMYQGDTASLTSALGNVTVFRVFANGERQPVALSFTNTNLRFEIVGNPGNATIEGDTFIAGNLTDRLATLGSRNVRAIFTNDQGEDFTSPTRQVMINPIGVTYTLTWTNTATINVERGGQTQITGIQLMRAVGNTTPVPVTDPAILNQITFHHVGAGIGISGNHVTAASHADAGSAGRTIEARHPNATAPSSTRAVNVMANPSPWYTIQWVDTALINLPQGGNVPVPAIQIWREESADDLAFPQGHPSNTRTNVTATFTPTFSWATPATGVTLQNGNTTLSATPTAQTGQVAVLQATFTAPNGTTPTIMRPINVLAVTYSLVWEQGNGQVRLPQGGTADPGGVRLYRTVGNNAPVFVGAHGDGNLSGGSAITRVVENNLGVTFTNNVLQASPQAALGVQGRNITAHWTPPGGNDANRVSAPRREVYVEEVGLDLPTSQVGCVQTGTPTNLWVDSTGVEWCVVAEQGDYTMLISRRVHRLPMQDGASTQNISNNNHSPSAFVPWPASTAQAGGPAVRGRMNNSWWNNDSIVSPELRGQAVHTNLRNLNDTLTQAQFNARNADTTMTSLPVAGSSNGLPFFLNPADINVRLGTTNAARQAHLLTGANGFYWLSTAGNNVNNNVLRVASSGVWSPADSATGSGTIVGVRPAVWVRR